MRKIDSEGSRREMGSQDYENKLFFLLFIFLPSCLYVFKEQHKYAT